MSNLEHYFEDGAKWQEQVILMLLKGQINKIIDDSWDKKEKKYLSYISVGRYENCREQGYVFTLWYDYKQLAHYCVFEHRNSDDICVIKFTKFCFNTPTIEEIWEGKESKYDITRKFDYMEFNEVTEYLIEDMKTEIDEHIKNLEKGNKNEE